MNENCSNQSQSSNRSHTRHILFVALNFSYRTSLSWTVFAFSSCFWLNSINSNSLPFNCTFNHNHYNLLKCDWCISCFIFHLSLCIVVIGQYSRTVGCNRTPVIGQITTNHTKFTQLNPPITELITITIATTTYPEKKKKKKEKRKKKKTGKFPDFLLQTLSPLEMFVSNVFSFSEIIMVMIYSLLWEGHHLRHFGLLAENFQMHFKFIPSVVKIVTSITKCDRTGAMRSLTMEKTLCSSSFN